ncbi:TVP38/TMEM64 family inner membrane protein YdjZ [Symmachiella dynata]|uniref:TVP38/TMEM64 family membrane protein n=1 Tax=Symmachiella dynata TaxID=2527995 RepID=A0A517ZUB4_9PLAN|nr:TVP38/TMEM64 family inner membrane protein YdjZ [Symmachiella dynata]
MKNRQRILLRLVIVVALVATVILFGRWMGSEIPKIEADIAALGFWGPLALVVIVALATPLFVPDTLFAVAAGVLFGLIEGAVIVVIGALGASCLCYVISRFVLRKRVAAALSQQPKIAAVAAAAERRGLKFQILLRLTPLSPVAVSYALGTTNTRFSTFILGCLGIIPGIFVEVYFGYVAGHAAKIAGNVSSHSRLHQFVLFAGLAVCIVLIIYVTRMARQALAEADPALSEGLSSEA